MPTELKCAKCGHEVQEGEISCPVCGASLVGEDAVTEKVIEVSRESLFEKPQKKYGGFWRRLVAALIDSFLLSSFFLVSQIIYFIWNRQELTMQAYVNPFFLVKELIWWQVFVFLITVLYFSMMESGGTMGTLGKMAMGIMVTDENENPISFPRAILRYFCKYISGIIIYIGYIMIAFTKKKQGLHDILAKTLVIRK